MERKPRTARDIDEQSLFHEDQKKSAKHSLRSFFRDKRIIVSQNRVLSDFAISTVMNTSYEEGFEYAHNRLLPRVHRDPAYYDPTMEWEVHVLVNLLAGMRAMDIPRVHHPGLTLLFFHFCKGWPIPDPPPLR